MQQSEVQPDSGAAETEQFMSVAAHDLRNPIAVVRASAQMAQRQISRGDANGANGRLKSIVEQTDRLTELLETFLDAARIGAGTLPMRAERTDLRDVIESASQRARLLVGDEPGERTIDIAVPAGFIGNWDRLRIARAMRALLCNAMLYGKSSEPVRVDARRNDDRVYVTITGGGPGPNGDEIGHLFERFYRGKSAAEAGQSGSGLGLFTARGIARAHGGDVRRIDGDQFEMELPLAG